jgi:hypothetical protein
MSTTTLSASFKMASMTSGDCLVVERTDGEFDIYKVWAEGARQCVRHGISDRSTAAHIANKLLVPDGENVYFKEASEPDSAIRLYTEDHQLRMVYA